MRYARTASLTASLIGWLAIGACATEALVDPVDDSASVLSVTVTLQRDTIELGGTFQASAHVETANNGSPPPVAWRSSAPAVAAVLSDGVVLGVAPGSARIVAQVGTKADSVQIWVIQLPAAVASVTVTPAAVTAVVGANVRLTAVTKDAAGTTLTGRSVAWSTSAPAIATVDASGLVTGVAGGSASITATSEGKSGSSSVTITTVAPLVASVSVTPASASVQIGQTVQVTATPKDANGTTLGGRAITWASSNPAAATVSTNGLVTGRAAGASTITATSEGKTGSAAITVEVAPPPPPPPPPPPGSSIGIWMSPTAIQALPASGPAWDNLKRAADSDLSDGVLSTRDEHNVQTMAAGLVAARLGSDVYRARVRESLRGLMANAISGSDPLAIVRRLGTYAIAADLIDLKTFDPAFDQQFRAWLDKTRKTEFGGETVAAIHERRPNNWGTHAGISRIAVAIYLGDRTDLERAALVFKGWLGDRTAYAGFTYNDVAWWQADPSKPVGINPKGATRDGHSIDGVLPDDQRRAGAFTWPPQKENYIYTALEGALGEAVLLSHQGYNVWNWSDRALLRAFNWLHEQANYPAEGNDCWQPYIINRAYGTNFPAPASSSPGKNIGWADWTHQR